MTAAMQSAVGPEVSVMEADETHSTVESEQIRGFQAVVSPFGSATGMDIHLHPVPKEFSHADTLFLDLIHDRLPSISYAAIPAERISMTILGERRLLSS